MKKFFSLVLALVMALSLTTVAWGAPVTYTVDPVNGTDTGTSYKTVWGALQVAASGDTITIVDGAVYDESGTAVDFDPTGEFTVTIKGNAPDYKMPIITFADENGDGDITVNIEGATLTFAELDARQNATINVKNSTIYDKGSNDIVKSYYNGAINIIDSTVDTMQLTTTGYINISSGSVVNVTWQTNVYENGLITIDATSTLNTAAFNLTGKAYNNRGNTERAGMPAEVIVDGGELNIGCDDVYGYHVGMYGINIGTENAAELTIQNGAEVNMEQYTEGTNSYAYAGEITVGTKGAINVEDGTLNVAKSDSGTGDVALNVEGKMNVAEDAAVNSSITEIAVSGTLKSAGDISGEISKETNGTIEVTGGSYTDDVSGYVADGSSAVLSGGKLVVSVGNTGNTNSYDASDVTIVAKDGSKVTIATDAKVVMTQESKKTVNGKFASVIPAHFTYNGVKYVVCHEMSATHLVTVKGVQYYTCAFNGFVPTVEKDGGALYTAPKKATCGKVGANEDKYVVIDNIYYLVSNLGTRYVLVNDKMVVYSTTTATAEVHVYDAVKSELKYNSDRTVANFKCAVCNNAIPVVAKKPAFATNYTAITLGVEGTYYYVTNTAGISAGSSTPSTDKTVTSAETFDAGIAMYVGMSVMAAAGSAVVLKKRED